MLKLIITSLIIKISIVLNQTCGVKDPKNLEDCLKSSSTNSICCYTKIQTHINMLNKNDTLCIFVPRSQIFITPHIKSLNIGSEEGDIEIELDCGFEPLKLKEGEPYSYCGVSPKNPYDCLNNSTPNASCCYIKNTNGESYCVLNNGLYNSNNSYFGVNIICEGNYIKFNIIIFCFIFFLSLIIKTF